MVYLTNGLLLCKSSPLPSAELTGFEPRRSLELFTTLIKNHAIESKVRWEALSFCITFTMARNLHNPKEGTDALNSQDSYFPPLLFVSENEAAFKTEPELHEAKATAEALWHMSMGGESAAGCRPDLPLRLLKMG